MTTRILQHPMVRFLAEHGVILGLVLRFFLAWFLPWLLDDGRFIPEVAYTDIDFSIFSDAAQYIQEGKSPYDRHTYRYTPFLAAFLAYLPDREWGRHIFCLADGLCGWIIIRFRQSKRKVQSNSDKNPEESKSATNDTSTSQTWNQLQDALWWSYNPLAINICTRGSSESIQVLLPVLLTLQLVMGGNDASKNQRPTLLRAFIAGISHGVAIHSKLYPIIYTLSFMVYLSTVNLSNSASHTTTFPWTEPLRLLRLIRIWVLRLFSPVPLVFLATSLLTFAGLTYLAVLWYGDVALQEGLLYHFSRVDHRHNYSMYWYWIYLARARTSGAGLALLGRFLLLPQVVLLVYSSLGVASHHLGLALFVQTFLFVTHNKVITAQYFTWYLCLLPLCTDVFSLTRRVQWAIAGLLVSIGTWLASAYCLEMQGMAVHRWVWMASVGYFAANVNLLGALLQSYTWPSTTTTATALDTKKTN